MACSSQMNCIGEHGKKWSTATFGVERNYKATEVFTIFATSSPIPQLQTYKIMLYNLYEWFMHCQTAVFIAKQAELIMT